LFIVCKLQIRSGSGIGQQFDGIAKRCDDVCMTTSERQLRSLLFSRVVFVRSLYLKSSTSRSPPRRASRTIDAVRESLYQTSCSIRSDKRPGLFLRTSAYRFLAEIPRPKFVKFYARGANATQRPRRFTLNKGARESPAPIPL
jgi:hypothetical protein